jgi:hypothetical protein
MQRDTLTPLDARNSLLLDRPKTNATDTSESLSIAKTGFIEVKAVSRDPSPERYLGSTPNPLFAPRSANSGYRPITPVTPLSAPNTSRENLVLNAAPVGGAVDMRQPTLPNLGGGGYNGGGYAGGYGAPAGGYRPAPQPGGYNQSGGYGNGYGYSGPYNRGPPSRGGY